MVAARSRDVETALGPVRLWARGETFDPSRPLVLAIGGAFSRRDVFTPVLPGLAGCDLVVTHLPGVHSRVMAEPSVERFAAAYDEVLAGQFPGRPVLRLGLSLGGVVALAMTTPGAVVAVDPVLSTAAAWPMHADIQAALGPDAPPGLADWCWRLLGIGPDRIEDRDYRHVVADAPGPGLVLVAADPLEPPRPVSRMPGFVPAADRAWLARLTRLKVTFVAGAGHHLLSCAPGVAMGAIGEALAMLQVRPSADLRPIP